MSQLYSYMTTRLQVLLEDDEFAEIREIAKRNRMTVAEWVRQALRAARRDEPAGNTRKKLMAVRMAVRGSYPTDRIQQMLNEIDRGHLSGPDSDSTA